jgi:hypothetical protein
MMSRLTFVLSSVAIVALVMAVAGCGSSEETSSEPMAMPAGSGESGDHAGHDHGDQSGHEGHDQHAGHDHAPPVEASKYAEAVDQLPMEDRMVAYAQKTCPVSGSELGSMGKPYKVTVKDRDVFLCCPGCEKAITDDPEKYLAKLSD